jgi:6-phosphogluconolactonase
MGSDPSIPANSGESGGSASTGGDGTATAYTVTATVTGLTGQGLVLDLNGNQVVPVAFDGTVVFPTALSAGSAYTVSVETPPSTQREICGVSNGSGTIAQANVTNVAINCSVVVGFLYEVTYNNQLLSYGISAGTGAPVPFGTPLATGANSLNLVTAPGGNFLYLGTPFDVVGTELPGSISVYAVDPATGSLTAVSTVITTGLNPGRMVMSPGGFLFVYGSQGQPTPPATSPDTLATYAVDAATGALTPTGTSLTLAYQGGTSLAVTPDGRFLYVLSGNFGSNTPAPVTLTAYAIDPVTGALTAGPTLVSTTDLLAETMAMDPLGRFLYLTSSQTTPLTVGATILPYAINSATGALTAIGTGTPIVSNADAIAADPTGHYLYVINNYNVTAANESVMALAVDQSSGVVSPLGAALLTAGAPATILCDPSGQFVYIGTDASEFTPTSSLLAFTISTEAATAGQLTPSGQAASPAALYGHTLAIVE